MRWLLKRWWFWTEIGFMLVALCAGYVLIPVERAIFSQETCDKIQLGWSEDQVEEELLCGNCEGNARSDYDKDGVLANKYAVSIWRNDEGDAIRVAFDRTGVIEKGFTPSNLSLLMRMKVRIARRIRALWP